MSAVAVAVGAGVAGIGGAIITSNAARDAANTQANAAGSANQTQWNIYQNNLANEAPYLQAGNKALGDLQSQMPDLTKQFSMQDFHSSPGYQFQLNQGLQAMQRSAAAKGMLNSVGTQQGLNNYAQGAANTDYQQALQNFTSSQNQRYGMLYGLAGIGQNAAAMTGNSGMNYANQTGANTMGAANATAAGQIGMANSLTGALSSGSNTFAQASTLSNLLNMKNGGAPASSAPMPGGSGGYSWEGMNGGNGFGGGLNPQPQYGLGIGSLIND